MPAAGAASARWVGWGQSTCSDLHKVFERLAAVCLQLRRQQMFRVNVALRTWRLMVRRYGPCPCTPYTAWRAVQLREPRMTWVLLLLAWKISDFPPWCYATALMLQLGRCAPRSREAFAPGFFRCDTTQPVPLEMRPCVRLRVVTADESATCRLWGSCTLLCVDDEVAPWQECKQCLEQLCYAKCTTAAL